MLVLIWGVLGIIGHIVDASRMRTWCGTPIWDEPSTYVMFFPAMILGPIAIGMAIYHWSEYADRWK